MNKIGTAFGCLLLLGAALVPGAFAHLDPGGHDIPYATTGLSRPANTVSPAVGDVSASGIGTGSGEDRVSGWYYGAANVWTELQSSPQTPDLSGNCPAALPPEALAACQALLSPLDPTFLFAAGNALCDMEVLGQGGNADPTAAIDEQFVDGSANSAAAIPGFDGTFNDGGIGAVCHTSGHYDNENYNTEGCDYDPAFAQDAVSGGEIWISTACDSTSPADTDGATIDEILLSFASQAINCPLGGFPDSCVDAVDYLRNCLGLPTATGTCDDGGDPGIVCGGDGVADVGDQGEGGQGVAFLPVHADCENVDGSAVVFVWNAVVLSGPPLGVPHASVATYGWVI